MIEVSDAEKRAGVLGMYRITAALLAMVEGDDELYQGLVRCPDDPFLTGPFERFDRLATAMVEAMPFPTSVPRERLHALCMTQAGAMLLTEGERYPRLLRFMRGQYPRVLARPPQPSDTGSRGR